MEATIKFTIPGVIEIRQAVWSRKYINDLPDSAFAYVEEGTKDDEGKTVPRTKRHLPYKDHEGKIDKAHLMNAWSRLPQTDISEEAKNQARKKLIMAAKEIGVTLDTKSNDVEEKSKNSYLGERTILRVEGYALMPGTYTGMNGLQARYDPDVILKDGFELVGRPVGQMHNSDNAGYVYAVDIDEKTARQKIYAEIYNSDAIANIKSGKYTGFSIDTTVWGYYQGKTFIVRKIGFSSGRVDLVDRPACSECLILTTEEITDNVKQRDDNMVEISKEEYNALLEAQKQLEQEKIKQSAELEAKMVSLIKEIKVKHATFDADSYLKIASTTEQKVAMLEALKEQLNSPKDTAPEPINAPPTVESVQQSLELELSSFDVEEFVNQQFRQYFNTDISMLKRIDEDFGESYESLMRDEARVLLDLAGE